MSTVNFRFSSSDAVLVPSILNYFRRDPFLLQVIFTHGTAIVKKYLTIHSLATFTSEDLVQFLEITNIAKSYT